MRSMLNEFYNYIADHTVGFFRTRTTVLRPGERYCLRLDTAEMVAGVDRALRERTEVDHIQGQYQYKNGVYETFTIRLSAVLEVIVASKINGMTDDFLATLRNEDLTGNNCSILMITHSPIDTITSGTGNLAAYGMPFHSETLIHKIRDGIRTAELPAADRILLQLELERKQSDRFSDKTSLFEYSDLLTVLGRGYVVQADYASFSLLTDDELTMVPEDQVRGRLLENHQLFEQIDRAFKYGNITEDLENEYDSSFLHHLAEAKKKDMPWYENYTFSMVKSSRSKQRRKLEQVLEIEQIEAFSDSPDFYAFPSDSLMFIREDGATKAKQRKKNILIFNPERRAEVTVRIRTNIAVKAA